jgi:hypothetical protein
MTRLPAETVLQNNTTVIMIIVGETVQPQQSKICFDDILSFVEGSCCYFYKNNNISYPTAFCVPLVGVVDAGKDFHGVDDGV